MRLTTGTEVTDKSGRRGIITDSHIKQAGQYKGQLELVWIGARYGVSSASPEDLTEVPAALTQPGAAAKVQEILEQERTTRDSHPVGSAAWDTAQTRVEAMEDIVLALEVAGL